MIRLARMMMMSGLLSMSHGPAWANTQDQAPEGSSTPLQANTVLRDAQGQQVGTATLTEVPSGVEIHVQITRLPPGAHGFHLHAQGHCEGPDFKSAGGHFNPDGKQHGFKNALGAHAGDLPNLVVAKDGTADMTLVAKGLTLSPGRYSLLTASGTSLVVHAQADDYLTDPAGNAGPRIACGPISP